MKNNIDYSLYLCTDRTLMTSATVEESIEKAINGGVTLVQLREKDSNGKDFYELGLRVKKITSEYGVPLIINDRVDIALSIGADGVHVGQNDLSCAAVKKIVPENMVVGVSATNLEEAVKAEKDGADYIGVGAIFATGTKTDAGIVSKDELIAICNSVHIPIVLIGGINEKTISEFDGLDISGVAVVSAIIAQPDITLAAINVKKAFYKSRRKQIQGKKWAFFDLDGTLLDSLGVWTNIDNEFFKSRGITLPPDYFEKTMSMSFREAAEYTIKEFKLADTAENLMKEWHFMVFENYRKNIKLKPYVKEYLNMLLANGIHLAIVTSLGEELYMLVLKNNMILDMFEGFYSVNDVGVGKNCGKIYEYALKKCGANPSDVILFEDNAEAAKSGKDIGLLVVGVKDRHNLRQQKRLKQICDYYITDFIEAPVLEFCCRQ
jgi:thiamine-phosphate pyrophosphorylase